MPHGQALCRTNDRTTAMEPNPRECLFCHDDLPIVPGEPVNIAFLSHLERREECGEAFEVWKSNMQSDYLGY